jgi:hypothetical protein
VISPGREWGRAVLQDREIFGEASIHERSKIGSLADFSNLEHIQIPPELLSGYSVQSQPQSFLKSLPAGLKIIELLIYNNSPLNPETPSSYASFMDLALDYFPNLEQVGLIVKSATSRLNEAEREIWGVRGYRWLVNRT